MNNSFFNKSLMLSSIVLLLLVGVAISANRSAERLDIAGDFEALEETGLGDIAGLETIIKTGRAHSEKEPSINIILEEGVLLIPNSTDDNVGMYDPVDGTFLGLFITGYQGFYTPINAVPGPDGNVYVSDQVEDAVYVFNNSGTYLYTYADETDGLNNIRGIDFRGDTLFVTSGDDYVAMFDGPHSRLANFINDGSDPFDIMFLDDGRALLADIQGITDNVRLYNADGTLAGVLFNVSFPEQIQVDALAPGAYSEELLRSIAQLAGGDARIAIQTLKNAAYLAERENKDEIGSPHVTRAWNSAKDLKKSLTIKNSIASSAYRIMPVTKAQRRFFLDKKPNKTKTEAAMTPRAKGTILAR